MFNKLYKWLYILASDPEDKGEYASGYFQTMVGKEALALCKGRQGIILEIGCGSGIFSIRLAKQNNNSDIRVIDNAQEKLRFVENRVGKKGINNLHLSFQDAFNLSFNEEYFDTVVCINFLLMIDSIESVKCLFRQMKRVCKKQGRIIFEFRSAMNPIFVLKYRLARFYDPTIKDNPLKCYNPKQIDLLLTSLNLRVVRKRYLGAFIFKSLAPIIVIEAEKNNK